MQKLLILIVAIALILPACEPCPECGEPLSFEPSIEFIFINKDSLESLNSSIKDLNDIITSVQKEKTALTTNISAWNIELQNYRDSIEDGYTVNLDDTIKLFNNIADAKSARSLKDSTLDDLGEINASLIASRKVVNSGRVIVNEIKILETNDAINYTDSAENYNFPLLMQDPDIQGKTTTFVIQIGKYIDTIGFSYETNYEQDVQGYVKLRATSIDTIYNSFDSLIFNCEPPACTDNETTITAYF